MRFSAISILGLSALAVAAPLRSSDSLSNTGDENSNNGNNNRYNYDETNTSVDESQNGNGANGNGNVSPQTSGIRCVKRLD